MIPVPVITPRRAFAAGLLFGALVGYYAHILIFGARVIRAGIREGVFPR